MMTIVFAMLVAALGVELFGTKRLATMLLAAALVAATGLFLWEVYSPDYGFRMPWIQT